MPVGRKCSKADDAYCVGQKCSIADVHRSKDILLLCYLIEDIEDEQCLSKLLHSAAQCSVVSSNRRFGYLVTRQTIIFILFNCRYKTVFWDKKGT